MKSRKALNEEIMKTLKEEKFFIQSKKTTQPHQFKKSIEFSLLEDICDSEIRWLKCFVNDIGRIENGVK